MSVVLETTAGDVTVDLFLTERPTACMNFLKLCKLKYYNYNLFHTISRGFIAQTGDPTGSRTGGESIFGVLKGPTKRYFQGENKPRIKHTKMGLVSFVGDENFMIGSQFFITLGEDLTYLDEKHCVFGEVVEGFDVLEIINEVICDGDDRPYQDVRITHTVILDDPFPDPDGLNVPSRSPSPSAERMMGGRIAPDEEIDEMEGKSAAEIAETQADREAKARATILEMVGDIPDADMAPPENVLFVCKLNPVTTDEDLEIIFNRFGNIKSCEVIRDRKTGDSLQYAFIEFEDRKSCEDAYFKMDNILIDDRRIHVDFSQSVSKVKWNGKGRGVTHYDEKGRKIDQGSERETNKSDNSSNKYTSSSRNTKSEKFRKSYKYDKYENGRSRDSEFRTKSRSEYDRGAPTKYSAQKDKSSRNSKSHDASYSNRTSEYISKSRHERNFSPHRRTKNRSEDYTESHRNSSKRNFNKHSDSEEKYERISRRRDKEEKYVARPKTSTARKKKTKTSSSDSSDSESEKEKYKRKKTKQSKRSSSSDSSSESSSKYKKKNKRDADISDSDDKLKRKKLEKTRLKNRKSNDSSDSETYKKRKRR